MMTLYDMWFTIWSYAFGTNFAETDLPQLFCLIATFVTVWLLIRIPCWLLGLIPWRRKDDR